MIEPIVSLAFSVHSNPGVYAMLIGSGVSRVAGILTGWEIVIDLIRKIAEMTDEKCEPDPVEWYKKIYGKEPDYSQVLKSLAKSQSERNQLLKSYFEPNEIEKEEGIKVPTYAHKAIAELVSKRFIKIIITTNFDRLIEKALEEEGITPTVISTVDAVKGSMPFTHTNCMVFKIHGDYLDVRIKNTPDELENYKKPINQFLDKIFDEFGLIVCGWSAQWDKALCSAFERCKSHRFTTYWALRGKPNDEAKKII